MQESQDSITMFWYINFTDGNAQVHAAENMLLF